MPIFDLKKILIEMLLIMFACANYYHNKLSYCSIMSLNQYMYVSALVQDVSYPLKESAAVLSDDGK